MEQDEVKSPQQPAVTDDNRGDEVEKPVEDNQGAGGDVEIPAEENQQGDDVEMPTEENQQGGDVEMPTEENQQGGDVEMPTEENQGDEAEKVAEEEPGGGDQIAAEEDKVDETENAPEEDKGGEAEIPTEENQQDGEPAEENQEGDMPSEEQPGTNTQATKPSTGTGGGAGGGGGGRVSLATEDDIPDLIPIFLDSFSGAAKKKTFPETESGRKWLERSFANFLGSKSQYHPEGKVPVVRNANGKPVAFAISHVVQAGQNVVGNSWKQRWGDANGLPDVSEEQLAKFFEPFAKVHHLAVGPQAHVFIEFLMTKLQSRKNGYASEIMDWATKLADDLNCACYLDGGGRGMGICERAGFEAQDVEDRYGDIPPSVPMLRARATA